MIVKKLTFFKKIYNKHKEKNNICNNYCFISIHSYMHPIIIIMCYICPSIYALIINGYSHYAARVYLAAAFRAIIRHHTSTFYPAQETKFMEDVLTVHPSYVSIFKHIFQADTTLLARRVNHPTPTHDTGMFKVHCSKLADVVIHHPRRKF